MITFTTIQTTTLQPKPMVTIMKMDTLTRTVKEITKTIIIKTATEITKTTIIKQIILTLRIIEMVMKNMRVRTIIIITILLML